LFGAAIVVMAMIFKLQKRQDPNRSSTPVAAQATAAFLSLERQALQHDQTTWAPEVQALEFGRKIVSIWDNLRAATNPWPILRSIAFSSLNMRELGVPEPVQDGIFLRALDGPEQSYSTNDWLGLLREFEARGFVLEQSDWRHVAFLPETSVPAKSTFAVELHVLHRPSGARHQITFDLRIDWRLRAGDPEAETMRVEAGRVLSQTNAPQFSHWFSMELPLVPGLETLDPFLAVYDLNGDSRPEIVLVAQNLVLRPNNSRFTPEDLCTVPRERAYSAIFGDFADDGTVDYLCANLQGLHLFHGTEQGTFPAASKPAWRPREPLFNPFGLASGDVDGDGDLDVLLTQYKLPYIGGQMPTPFYDANDGFPSFLLLNDGRGVFSDITMEQDWHQNDIAGPIALRSSISTVMAIWT
jgi:hypothetical protein